MNLTTIQNVIQHFVDRHLPGQSVTRLQVVLDFKEDKRLVYVDVDDYDIIRALQEIDDETSSDLVGIYENCLINCGVIV